MIDKPRRWWVAGLLSLFEPGLGQIYNGQARKGIFFLLLPLGYLPAISLFISSNNIFYYLIFFVCLAVVYYLIAIGDAIRTAWKLRTEYILKRYNYVFIYLGIILAVFIVNTVTSSFVKNYLVKAYKIPAGSGEPTLLIGDHILTDSRSSSRKPERGDIVVFEFPEDPMKDFVKRVVAMGGDTVEIRDKKLLINHEAIVEQYITHRDTKILSANQGPRDNYGPIRVPEGSYFVMGDNRDQSYDSRFWGFVENSKIKGTVKSIYWSWDKNTSTIRWNRIGKIVQ